jgi:hypothetical protein
MSRVCRIHVKPNQLPSAADLQREVKAQGFNRGALSTGARP